MRVWPAGLVSALLLAGCSLPQALPQSDEVAPAAQTPSAACQAGSHRQFDFWLGQWTVVRDGGQAEAARNDIRRILNGCALQEVYHSPGGYSGRSLSWYDAERAVWRQTWVDTNGLVLQLLGGLNAQGHMVMYGPPRDAGEDRKVRDRISWLPQADGSVLQYWDVANVDPTAADSAVGQWTRIFSGRYLQTAPASSSPAVRVKKPR